MTDLDAFLDGLKLDQVALAGHFLAAHMVALYAATRPSRVRALVLLNPAPPFAPEFREAFGKTMSSRRTPEDVEEKERVEASTEYEAGAPDGVERYYQVLYTPYFNDRDAALGASCGITEIRASMRDTGKRLFGDFGEHDLPGRLGNISCPALVVHGELDPVPLASSAAIAEAIPGGELVVIPGGNHFAFLETPEIVATAIEPFLATHAS